MHKKLPYFIAEVSSNHAQNLERCFQFIDTAAEIGCDAVKFQLFKIDELFAPEILNDSEPHRKRRAWELPLQFLPELSKRCQQQNIAFSCTPFYLKAVEELEPYVDFFKISSYELLWSDLIQRCSETGKPLVISTGMATEDEIRSAVTAASGCEKLTLLHCVSAYPTPIEQCNLKTIETLRNTFGCDAGWSDHSVSPAVLYRATQHMQASMIEFHLDLDKKGEEYEAGHCWLPEQIYPVIKDIKQAHLADGSSSISISKSELPDRDWRADPSDGLRPLLKTREIFKN
ncbi:N-acetylneuraminate synthase family protein [Neptuniibacter sp.]|uniref:N-acetylneuraminate synthase family protein n=1 Tax=Neptuniibacter sp. TaxID=1962643 RepID=UPI00263583B4|nr:N-acetylneuraminate synthase family protein [Neptuniibacter sp.]MCP4595904.1 N-acetylneuraminic acid synthase [Neptuniibacter sp.]